MSYLLEGRKSPRAKIKPNTSTATPTPIYSMTKAELVICVLRTMTLRVLAQPMG